MAIVTALTPTIVNELSGLRWPRVFVVPLRSWASWLLASLRALCSLEAGKHRKRRRQPRLRSRRLRLSRTLVLLVKRMSSGHRQTGPSRRWSPLRSQPSGSWR